MNTLYLIRHAENYANLTKQFSHRRVDYSLTPRRILQAQQLAAFLGAHGLDELYTSPLKRAQETAAYLGAAVGCTPVVMEEFREINVGTLEDEPPTLENWALHDRILRGWFTGAPEGRFPDGEDYAMLLARIRDGLTAITRGKEGRHIAVVGHGGAFACTITALCPNARPEEVFAGHFQNGAITELRATVRGDQFIAELVYWGDHAHLSGDAATFVSPVPDPVEDPV